METWSNSIGGPHLWDSPGRPAGWFTQEPFMELLKKTEEPTLKKKKKKSLFMGGSNTWVVVWMHTIECVFLCQAEGVWKCVCVTSSDMHRNDLRCLFVCLCAALPSCLNIFKMLQAKLSPDWPVNSLTHHTHTLIYLLCWFTASADHFPAESFIISAPKCHILVRNADYKFPQSITKHPYVHI